jgi:hypothetical protein
LTFDSADSYDCRLADSFPFTIYWADDFALLHRRNYDRAVAAAKAAKSKGSIFSFWLSAAYAAQGDKEKALATLQEALNARYRDFAALDASPYFSQLRYPRYQQLVQRYRR